MPPEGWSVKGPAHREEHRTPKGSGQKAAKGTGPSGRLKTVLFGGVGLTAAKRTNTLTVVETAEDYPEALFSRIISTASRPPLWNWRIRRPQNTCPE